MGALTDRDGIGKVGPIAYGCWRFSGTDVFSARAKIEAALDVGMNLVDTADIYGYDGSAPAPGGGFGAAETLLGRVLAESPGLREHMVLATKGGITPPVPYDSRPAYLRAAVDASLERLGVERIDLYQIHRPDVLVHPAEVGGVLDELVRSGKVAAVGVSNHTVAQTEALAGYMQAPLVSTQPEYSALELGPLLDGTFDACALTGRTVLAWSPLGGGRLAGAPDPDDPRAVEVCAVCDRMAAERGVTRTAVLLAWVMAHPVAPVPIIGTQRIERIGECARAVEVRLEPAQWYEVLTAARGEPLP